VGPVAVRVIADPLQTLGAEAVTLIDGENTPSILKYPKLFGNEVKAPPFKLQK